MNPRGREKSKGREAEGKEKADIPRKDRDFLARSVYQVEEA